MSKKGTIFLIFLMLISTIKWTNAEEKGNQAVTITEEEKIFSPKPDLRVKSKKFNIRGKDGPNYTLSFGLRQKKQSDETWKTIGCNVGMPFPTLANWYHGGFLNIRVNKIDIFRNEPELVEVVETGKKGILDYIWKTPIPVRARFIAEPGNDYLLLEIRWEKSPEIKNLNVSFFCYPQGYNVSVDSRLKGEKLQRHMITPTRDVPQEQTVNLILPDEYWQLYMDSTLEKNPVYSPDGPCGLAFVPEDIKQAKVRVGSYQIRISVDLKAENGKARFAIWDFTGKSFKVAKKIISEEAPVVVKNMKKVNWLPSSISSFDIEKEREKIRKLEEKIGRKKEEIREQLALLEKNYSEVLKGENFIENEIKFRDNFLKYSILLWQAEKPFREKIRTLILAGLFYNTWKIEEIAKSTWGKENVKCGYHNYARWAGHSISYFPSTMKEMINYDVVVLANISPEPLSEKKQKMLLEFVNLGGGLLILGGYYGYAENWKNSPLYSLFPVIIEKKFNLLPNKEIGEVQLTEKGIKYLGKIDKPLGMVSWRNDVKVKSSAEILATAGNNPFLVMSKEGKGRVMAIVSGVIGEGKLPFWSSPGWEEFLKRVLLYLATERK